MTRVDETLAAKEYMRKLESGYYPLERAKNNGTHYSETKEERDTEAVREFTESSLFMEFKETV